MTQQTTTSSGPAVSEASLAKIRALSASSDAVSGASSGGQGGKSISRLTVALMIGGVLLVLLCALSFAVGSRMFALDRSIDGFLHPEANTIESKLIWAKRAPRTAAALLVGAALAVSGVLMQALSRNPLAEPGLMGVNAGAAVAVIGSVVVFGVMGIWQYMVAATIGGALAAVLVYTLGRGRDGSIVKLALAGVAISAALSAIAQGLILADQDAYNEFRVWVAGSLEGRGMDIASTVGPVIVLGMLVAFFVAPAINALSMGEEAATSLGVSVRTTQNLTLLAVTVLAGAATAAVGPIGFVGLAVPFVVRALLGNDVRWVNYGSALLGPVWLLCADVLARVLVAPQETQVGIVATLAGAPVFLFLMTRRKVEAL